MNIYLLMNLIVLGFIQASVATLLVYFFCINPVVVAWERRMWTKLKKLVRRQLRKSKRIVAWAETPAKHGSPDEEWIAGQVRVFGDEWR